MSKTVDPELCGDNCPVQRAAQVFDGKWTTLVLRDLLSGKKRFSQLQRSLTGISPRLLSARLKLLEQQGLVSRMVFDTVPPTTEYALTGPGMRIIPVIQALADYGQVLLDDETVAAQHGSTLAPQQEPGVTLVRNGKRVA